MYQFICVVLLREENALRHDVRTHLALSRLEQRSSFVELKPGERAAVVDVRTQIGFEERRALTQNVALATEVDQLENVLISAERHATAVRGAATAAAVTEQHGTTGGALMVERQPVGATSFWLKASSCPTFSLQRGECPSMPCTTYHAAIP